MSRIYTLLCIACFALAFAAPPTQAHPGGTNAQGCHTNHKTGGYHCHNAKTPPPGRVTYCHEVNGDSRCGYALSTCQDLVRKYGGYCRQD